MQFSGVNSEHTTEIEIKSILHWSWKINYVILRNIKVKYNINPNSCHVKYKVRTNKILIIKRANTILG